MSDRLRPLDRKTRLGLGLASASSMLLGVALDAPHVEAAGTPTPPPRPACTYQLGVVNYDPDSKTALRDRDFTITLPGKKFLLTTDDKGQGLLDGKQPYAQVTGTTPNKPASYIVHDDANGTIRTGEVVCNSIHQEYIGDRNAPAEKRTSNKIALPPNAQVEQATVVASKGTSTPNAAEAAKLAAAQAEAQANKKAADEARAAQGTAVAQNTKIAAVATTAAPALIKQGRDEQSSADQPVIDKANSDLIKTQVASAQETRRAERNRNVAAVALVALILAAGVSLEEWLRRNGRLHLPRRHQTAVVFQPAAVAEEPVEPTAPVQPAAVIVNEANGEPVHPVI